MIPALIRLQIQKWNNWLGHHPTLRRLQLIALLRSIGQGFAAVETSLYLKDLGWSGASIGGLFAAAGLFRTLITTFTAEINALLGPKKYLLLYECLTAAAALLVILSSGTVPLCLAVIIAGFGMGHSGSGGPAAPIERRWLGAFSRKLNILFGKHALLGYAGMGIGALVACLTPLLLAWLPDEKAYRLLFILPALCAAAGAALLLSIQGGARRRAATAEESNLAASASATLSPSVKPVISRRKSLLLIGGVILLGFLILFVRGKADLPLLSALMPVLLFLLLIALALIRVAGGSPEEMAGMMNMVQTVAVTLTSTMSAYWFSERFQVSASEVGLVIALSYLLAGALSYALMHASERMGPIKPVVGMQLAGAACVLLLPLTPSFVTAASLYVLSSMFNLGTRGTRYAVMMNEQPIRKQRTWSSRLASFLIRLGAVLWPGAFGRMIDEGEHMLPFFLAAAIQLFSTWRYSKKEQTKAPLS
ncbi:hypothetical protein [Paenibacillus sp. JDR-2]|uniref:hypothetical protein n=1 Tax=Paenibacillus sp. (strain JDR-2) TaxID=324057 RepID=UPI000166ADE5|nr:hypothetical protein [Paenibacillus sp. JDR-2]ACT04605.1 hypothetical protein Pjdr2_6001 [Paenibacillus sp. JDR-2]